MTLVGVLAALALVKLTIKLCNSLVIIIIIINNKCNKYSGKFRQILRINYLELPLDLLR